MCDSRWLTVLFSKNWSLGRCVKVQIQVFYFLAIPKSLGGEFKHFHRENSINIPLNKLRQRCDNLDRSACYVVVDNAGPRAELGAYLLMKAGLQAYLLKSDSE